MGALLEDSAGPVQGDAFGEGLLNLLERGVADIVLERDDGFVNVDRFDYFSPPQGPHWDWIRARLGQRVLDVGCGAGRGCLALQELGIDVIGLDVSPGALEVCRHRGVRSTFLGTVIDLAATAPPPFDSFLCLGNNLGLLASPDEAPLFLKALGTMSHNGSKLLGTMLDPYSSDDPIHLRYHEANRRVGRMGGHVRIRVRHLRTATAWFSLLWASPQELTDLASTVEWTVSDIMEGAIYGAELRPTERVGS